MSKRIPIKAWRDYASTLRFEAMEACILANGCTANIEPRKWASYTERANTKRKIANEIDAMLDGEKT